MIEVLLHLRRQYLINGPAAIRQHRELPPKPFPDRLFSEMSERWIPDIMDQPCALQDVADILFHPGGETGIFLIYQNIFSDVLSQRLGEGRHLQRMGKPRPDKITLIQRKYLRLILQAPKRRTADNTVIVSLEFASQIRAPYMLPRIPPASLR